MANSAQHFCFIAAIEYPMNTIMAENRSNVGVHSNISISKPNNIVSIFLLNHKYAISINTTMNNGINNTYLLICNQININN